MKRLAFVFLLLSGSAWAQPPQEIETSDQISVGVGQAKVFRFDEPFGRIDFMPKDTADAVPQSDRQLSIIGIKAGISQMFVFSPDGKQIYSAAVTVSPEPGRLVKIYGTGKNDDLNSGFIAVYCDASGCGRPDKDLPMPTAITVERSSRRSTSTPNNRTGF
jgi:Flp pilus assembly secretin CpaC